MAANVMCQFSLTKQVPNASLHAAAEAAGEATEDAAAHLVKQKVILKLPYPAAKCPNQTSGFLMISDFQHAHGTSLSDWYSR